MGKGFGIAWWVALLIGIAFWVTVGYVAVHFIAKWW